MKRATIKYFMSRVTTANIIEEFSANIHSKFKLGKHFIMFIQ